MSFTGKLPFLPGYQMNSPPKERYHKSHHFDINNGLRVDLSREPAIVVPGIEPSFISTSNSFTATSPPPSSSFSPSSTSNLSRLPAWVAYDRKVLRFYGYFAESVHSSPAESWRIRQSVIYFYLEDDSIHIAEPKQENSGLPQGVFVKRHRIPKQGSNSYFSVEDLSIGAELAIYGRVFRLIDCDGFTREFYRLNGREFGEAETYPVDPHAAAHTRTVISHNKTMHPHKLYMEASLGKHMHQGTEATQKFLNHDGKVLRFYCQWNDDKMYGEKRPYILHYFLADETVEISEVQQPNSGRDPFPTLLRRSKLPVNWTDSSPDVNKLGITKEESNSRCYNAADLRVGSIINVFGRALFLCGADEFTQQYYMKNYGLQAEDFPRLNMEDPVETVKKLEPPPYNGFGSEEDSLGSYLFLMPQVPKADWKKLIENDGMHLRFMAQFLQPSKVDKDRKFIVTYYLSHDQLSIFEKFERNSGFIGGKFLERSRLKNPNTAEYYRASDLYVGAVLEINKYQFLLIESDEYTAKFMNANPQVFKKNNTRNGENANHFAGIGAEEGIALPANEVNAAK